MDRRKFDRDDILEMAMMRFQEYTLQEIADYFECTINAVDKILRGQTGLARKVLGQRLINNLAKLPRGNRKLTKREVFRMLEMRNEGMSHAQLAEYWDVSVPLIQRILNGTLYTDITGINTEDPA